MPNWARRASHLRDVIQCLCVLRCDNIRHVMPNWVRHAIARRIDIENNLNSCAPHTTGESGFAPTELVSNNLYT